MKRGDNIEAYVQANSSQKFGIVVAEFNKHFTEEMLAIAQGAFKECGACVERIEWVPGAFELPLISQKLFDEGIDVVLALGVVIRGETSHYDIVCESVAQGIMQLSLKNKKPLIFGVLTCENQDQVKARIPRARDLAISAVKMGLLMSNE